MTKKISPFSLYIHFPFCKRKCRYCDFYSVSYDAIVAEHFIKALKQEWLLAGKEYHLSDCLIQTIYCGGGTPSLLTPKQWQLFCSETISNMNISPDVEWTIECNPDSFTLEKAEAWRNTGVNRLTIGIQSLNDRELRCLGRCHNAEQALNVLSDPVLKPFASVGIDIIYGIPGQTPESLDHTLKRVFSLDYINHLSAYELTIPVKTPFSRHRKLLPLPSEESVAEMTGLILSTARKHSFEQYEVSNYARDGHQSMHNKAYWNHLPYLGLGPSAHSYFHPKRFSNIADVDAYISRLSNGQLPMNFCEYIDIKTLEHEMIFLGLRTREGLDENRFHTLTGKKLNNPEREKVLAELIDSKYLEYNAPMWFLTDKGMFMADAIARKLL